MDLPVGPLVATEPPAPLSGPCPAGRPVPTQPSAFLSLSPHHAPPPPGLSRDPLVGTRWLDGGTADENPPTLNISLSTRPGSPLRPPPWSLLGSGRGGRELGAI